MARDTAGLPLDEKAEQGVGRAVDSRELRMIVERWDRLAERASDLADDRRDFWTWAKARGWDVDGLRLYLSRRKNRDRWRAKAAMADLYEDVLDQDTGPLFDDVEIEAQNLREVLRAAGVLTREQADRIKVREIAERHGYSAAAIEAVLGAKPGKPTKPKAEPERVEITTPKGRRARVRAADPIAAATAAAAGDGVGTKGARQTAGAKPAGESLTEPKPKAKRPARTKAKPAAAASPIRASLGRLPPEPESIDDQPLWTPEQDAERIERNRQRAAPKAWAKNRGA